MRRTISILEQNSYEPQLVQALANFFRLLYNVLMRHLLFTSADTPVEGVACIETLRDDSEITCLSREEIDNTSPPLHPQLAAHSTQQDKLAANSTKQDETAQNSTL